jgi:hypothetical protein
MERMCTVDRNIPSSTIWKSTVYTFDQVKRYLKLSKSGKVNEGPYTIVQHEHWFDIVNASGTVVGQGVGKFILGE